MRQLVHIPSSHSLAPSPTPKDPFLPSSPTPCSLACIAKARPKAALYSLYPSQTFFQSLLKIMRIQSNSHVYLETQCRVNVALHVCLNPGGERPVYTLYPSTTKFVKKHKMHRQKPKMYTLNSRVALRVALNPGEERFVYTLYPSMTKFSKKHKMHRRELTMYTYKPTCRLACSLKPSSGAIL